MKNPNPADLEITASESEDSQDAKLIHENLRDLIAADVGPSARKPLVLAARLTSSPELAGGLRGFSHWSWLYISHLWVSELNRSKKIGQNLLQAAIAESKSRKLKGLYVDTFSERAREFYLQNGFAEFGRIENFPPNKTRFYLKLEFT